MPSIRRSCNWMTVIAAPFVMHPPEGIIWRIFSLGRRLIFKTNAYARSSSLKSNAGIYAWFRG